MVNQKKYMNLNIQFATIYIWCILLLTSIVPWPKKLTKIYIPMWRFNFNQSWFWACVLYNNKQWCTPDRHSKKNCTSACLLILLKFYFKILLKWCTFVCCQYMRCGITVVIFSHHQSLTTRNQFSGFNCTFRSWQHVYRLHSSSRWTTTIMYS